MSSRLSFFLYVLLCTCHWTLLCIFCHAVVGLCLMPTVPYLRTVCLSINYIFTIFLLACLLNFPWHMPFILLLGLIYYPIMFASFVYIYDLSLSFSHFDALYLHDMCAAVERERESVWRKKWMSLPQLFHILPHGNLPLRKMVPRKSNPYKVEHPCFSFQSIGWKRPLQFYSASNMCKVAMIQLV